MFDLTDKEFEILESIDVVFHYLKQLTNREKHPTSQQLHCCVIVLIRKKVFIPVLKASKR